MGADEKHFNKILVFPSPPSLDTILDEAGVFKVIRMKNLGQLSRTKILFSVKVRLFSQNPSGTNIDYSFSTLKSVCRNLIDYVVSF